jgi:anaerobic magnesium-protoporphyrin IX monomethyl ester cyclase
LKNLLIAINSKFIHTNTAIRYLKANCSFSVEILEFTIKDEVSKIIQEIIERKPEIIGFSCYIWNIEIIEQISLSIKLKLKNCIIIFGGPEVSYEYDEYLLKNYADYIVINEGEETFDLLLKSISDKTNLDIIPNLAYIKENEITKTPIKQIQNLDKLKSPYYLDEDIKNIPNKIQYVELSRGCPYRCSYCLASLEKGLRFIQTESIFEHLDYLNIKGAKTIKFLDRSFNANKSVAYNFFKTLIDKDYQNTIFQFEINGDILDESLIDLLAQKCKPNYIRFELGIQSTNEKVNLAVNRKQNTTKLIKSITQLLKTNVILHLDLIAGLPFEDLASFKNTFNEIFNLHAKELQLGFLKLLKGTKLKKEADIHNYEYSNKPPYEIVKDKYISQEELTLIHHVEIMLDIYWNKGFMNESIIRIISHFNDPFDFFLKIYDYYQSNNLSFKRYQLYDLFINLMAFINYNGIKELEILDELKFNYLSFHKIKPKVFWKDSINKQAILRELFSVDSSYNLDKLYKYSTVTTYKDGYLISLYYPKAHEHLYFANKNIKKIG